MQKLETLNYEEQFKEVVVSFSPFVLNSTGIVQSQTALKVDTYTLACVPYQISMGRVVLIGSFSKDEIVYFQRYKGSLAGLTLSIQHPTVKEPEKIFCRCQISGVGLMKGRDRVGLIVCDFKPIPPALAKVLGEHLIGVETLRIRWQDYKDKTVQVNAENSRRLGYNNYAVMTAGGDPLKLALYTLSVNRLEFIMPFRSPDLAADTPVAVSLYFQKYRFSVSGKIEKAERLVTGAQKVRASIDFSPELCDLMAEFFTAPRQVLARPSALQL
jgi:hypothetical protein